MNAPAKHGKTQAAAVTLAALPPLDLPPGAYPPSAGRIDRAARRRTEPDWLDHAWTRARVLTVDKGRVLVRDDPPRLVLLDPDQAPGGERYFLGVDADAIPYFAMAGRAIPSQRPGPSEVPVPSEGVRPVTLHEVGHLLGRRDADLFVTAVALLNWHARHRYSQTTGRPTTVSDAGWTRVTADGETIWPRTDPAVIMLVQDGVPGPGGRCLLGHNTEWTAPGWSRRYSCLAGFVEPGEPAEASVFREVAEEVGVSVSDIRYLTSQAWPFPGSLMLGFLATADPAQPVCVDAVEISDARWFSRSEVVAVLSGERTDFELPMGISIAYYLLRTWLAG